MDTSEYPSLPSLSQANARLAANSRRVTEVVSAQLDGIERLFTATTSGDWEAIARASRYLAKQDPAHLDEEVIRQARQVCDELSRGKSHTRRPQHLDSLLAACRVARQHPPRNGN